MSNVPLSEIVELYVDRQMTMHRWRKPPSAGPAVPPPVAAKAGRKAVKKKK